MARQRTADATDRESFLVSALNQSLCGIGFDFPFMLLYKPAHILKQQYSLSAQSALVMSSRNFP